MRSYTVFTDGSPGAFDLSPGAPMYWTERLSYVLLTNFYWLHEQNFEFRQMEEIDIPFAEAEFNDYSDSFFTWIGDAITAQEGGYDPPTVPSLPELAALAVSGGNVFISMLIKFGIELLLRWLERKFAGGTEIDEVADLFQRAFLPTGSSIFGYGEPGEERSVFYSEEKGKTITDTLLAGLTRQEETNGEETKSTISDIAEAIDILIEIVSVLKRGLLAHPDEIDEFAWIELLRNTPLEIILSQTGEYQDFLYSDRPET